MRAFDSVKDLVGSLYDVLYDAANKVWSLAKPVLFVGLVVDLVSGKLGWIGQIVGYYKQIVDYTSGASTLVVVIIGLVVLSWANKN